jgi:GH25 family lysozyme M1 (1,4-beta-N-acetylmuramidase)
MTEYYVTDGKDYTERFYKLTDAKRAMKEHGARGYKTKIYANGDFVDCGEITLKGDNRTWIANTRMNRANY